MASPRRHAVAAPFAEVAKWPVYWLLGRLFHQPELLRLLCTALRRLRASGSTVPVARYRTLRALFRREASFSNTAHAPCMPADPNFLIGMEAGPACQRERAFLTGVLPSPQACASASAVTSKALIQSLQRSSVHAFNLVDDYMEPLVWSALRQAFGSAATQIEKGTGPEASACPMKAMKKLFLELRYLGAHLIVGGVAPRRIQIRAVNMARRVKARVRANLGTIRFAARAFANADAASIERNAVGLMWVGHPATVQSGALIMQDLIGRPGIYRLLREQAVGLGDAVWTDPAFRALLRAHVLESLRFRPPFPLLTRDVPRAATFDAGGKSVVAKAGSSVTLLTIGAMFDPDAITHPNRYIPGRADADWSDIDNRYLMFGYGPRSCIAKHQVVEVLVSALAGLLLLPRLMWADPWWRRIGYEGPIIVRMRLRFKTGS